MMTNKNSNSSKRRLLLKSMLAAPIVQGFAVPKLSKSNPAGNNASRLKISLNAYSFNQPLTSGSMSIADMLTYCADTGILAVDITAYYFPGYPNVPSDSFLYEVKRKAFKLGVEISGTGVRNDFTEPDPVKRKESVELVKNWIIAAEKIGAPVIRIFAGNKVPEGYTRDQVLKWMLDDIRTCIEFGKSHGVIVAVQNHNDFLKTADEVTQLLTAINNSEWFGLILDTGSYRMKDPYDEIAKTIRFAVNWQVKEKIFVGGKEVDVDMPKLVKIIKASDYRGYLPVETLGEGDPKIKVQKLVGILRAALES